MQRIRWCFILFVLLSVKQLGAQQATVSGVVTQATTGEKLLGVIVMTDTVPAASTDTAGFYQLALAPGSYQLTFKLLGFESRTINVSLMENETKKLNVSLSSAAQELGVVVVSAGRFEQRLEDVTVSMNVIKPGLIENTNTTNMEDFMGQVPGVNITDGQANIRGGSGWSYGAGSRVLTLVDDVPILSGDANDVKWNFVPIENLEQVEVIKGASSALYGSSALNGIINFRTKYPKSTPATTATFFTGVYDKPERKELKWWGTNNQLISGYSISHSRQIKQHDITAGINYFRDDGYRAGEEENWIRFNTSYRYRFKKAEGLTFSLKTNSMYNYRGIFFYWDNDSTGALIPAGGLDTATTTLSISNTIRHSIDPSFTYIKKNGTSHRLSTRYFTTINKNNTNQSSASEVYFAEYQFQKKIKDIATLTVGAANAYADVTSELYGSHQENNLSGFAQADIRYKKISLSLGGRMEKSRLDTAEGDWTPVFRSGLNFHIFKETYLRASYGQGYRFPSIAEKYVSTEIGMVKIFPNDSLKPETGWSAEAGLMQGIKIFDWKGYFDIAVFQSEYKDMIEFGFGTFPPAGVDTSNFFNIIKYLGFRSDNIGHTRISGIDLSLSGEGKISNVGVALLLGYTFMKPYDLNHDASLDTSGQTIWWWRTYHYKILKYRYRHLFKGDVECSYKKFSVGVSVRYNSFMETIDHLFETGLSPGLPAMHEYREEHHTGDTVWDFRCAYKVLTNLKASFLIKNALNREYIGRPYDMQPPRSFTLQFSLTL